MYLMRVIKNFGTRELILMGVELPWIFLFKHCYCKIADLVRRKGRFETKKQKDVRHDGTLDHLDLIYKQNHGQAESIYFSEKK